MTQISGVARALTNNANRWGWVRTPAVRLLVVAGLAASLALGGSFLLIEHRGSTARAELDRPRSPLSDELTEAQVVESANRIVTVAGLQKATAGYTLLSCKNEHDPPYQGAIYLNFALPGGAETAPYFRQIAVAMIAHGWQEGIPPGQDPFGKTISKDGVIAIFYRNRDVANRGIMRIYGPCRDMANHRADETDWIDVTDQIN